MTQAVHTHGGLAGIELTHAGLDAANQFWYLTPIGPSSQGVLGGTEFELPHTGR